MRKPQTLAQGSQVLLDEFRGKTVVTGRYGRMCGEHHLTRYAGSRAFEIQALILHAVANRLQNCKCAVSFIQVQDPGSHPHCTQRVETSYTQQQFLPDPGAPISSVEPRSQLPVLGRISFNVRIEKQKIAPADLDTPDFYANGAAACLNFECHGLALKSDGGLHRQLIGVSRQVLFPLPAISVQTLAEIALAIKQTNADEGNAQVRCALDVIAG